MFHSARSLFNGAGTSVSPSPTDQYLGPQRHHKFALIVPPTRHQARVRLCKPVPKARTACLAAKSDPSGDHSRRSVLLGLSLLPAAPQAASAKVNVDPASDRQCANCDLDELQIRATQTYRGRDLQTSLELYDRIVELDPDNPVWYERRGQVQVDLKRFDEALSDFRNAERRQPDNYKSLGLIANKGLAHEGLSQWESAIDCYSEVIELSNSIGGTGPYILNSRGNCMASLQRWTEALADYQASVNAFQTLRNISGVIYASSNVALMQAQLGEDDLAIQQMKNVARRAPGSIDMRAALAAMYWGQGDEEAAEQSWGWACEKINSGQMVEGGPVLDGCALYRDRDWLTRIRRWPPVMVDKMDAFLRLQAP